MFRFLITVLVTAGMTLAFLVGNPGGAGKGLLEFAGLLDRLKESYEIDQ